MTQHCSVIGCAQPVPEGAALCRSHWSRVSPRTSAAVLASWRALKRKPGELPRSPTVVLSLLSAYCDALARAVAEAAGAVQSEDLP